MGQPAVEITEIYAHFPISFSLGRLKAISRWYQAGKGAGNWPRKYKTSTGRAAALWGGSLSPLATFLSERRSILTSLISPTPYLKAESEVSTSSYHFQVPTYTPNLPLPACLTSYYVLYIYKTLAIVLVALALETKMAW